MATIPIDAQQWRKVLWHMAFHDFAVPSDAV
jgi:hypothetical protein